MLSHSERSPSLSAPPITISSFLLSILLPTSTLHIQIMRFATSIAAGSALFCAVSAAPASVPSSLPNPSTNQIAQLISGAGGNLPGGSPPSSLSSAATTTLQLIAFNEMMESAFFNQLCGNISASATGYTLDGFSPNEVVKSLTAILNVSLCT